MLLRASTGSIAVPPPQQVIIPNHQQQQQHSPKHNQESELDPNANAEQGVEPELHPEQEPNKGQELGPKQQPSADSSRSQHSNGSNVSVGRTAAAAASSSTPSHPSHRSLAGLDDENDNGCGSARSSIMTAKPLAHDTEDDGPTVSADVNNSISAVCSVKDESISRTEDDDGEHKEDIVDDVVREYAFDDAPRLETPRTSALFDDSESSIYFSSTSAPPSPSSVISDDHSINGIAIPTLEAEDEEEEDTPATPRAYTPPRSDIYIPMLNHPHS
ncbi:hypothetical protein BX666DRAFT_1202140 [Dichotomocladium elegans]|nr:hypothetical protein BX666DRAFT_1202140 [Dichotomocladium elegans]